MFYSPSTSGFYIDSDAAPIDVVEITSERHRELLNGQSAGRRIAPGVDGIPVIEYPPTDYQRIREFQKRRIEDSRNAAEAAEFVFEHNGINWDGGLMSKSRLRETIDGFNAAGGLPPGFFWTDADNNDIEIDTLAELDALFDAMSIQMVQRGFAIHAQQRALKQQITDAPDDVSAIQSIVWSE